MLHAPHACDHTVAYSLALVSEESGPVCCRGRALASRNHHSAALGKPEPRWLWDAALPSCCPGRSRTRACPFASGAALGPGNGHTHG